MKSRWGAILVVVLIVAVLAAGGVLGFRYFQGRPTPSTPTTLPLPVSLPTLTPPSEGEVVIPDTTKVLTGTTSQHLSSISPDGAVLTFSQSTSQLESLSQGDVIVGDVSGAAPDGFLRKVQSVTTRGGQVVVQTEPAHLEEAVQTGSVSYSGELQPSDVRAGWKRPGVELASAGPTAAHAGWNVTLDNVVLLDADGNPTTTGDQIRGNGRIAFVPTLDFDLDIAWFRVKKLTLVARATETVDIHVSGNVQLMDVDEEVQVAFFPLNAIPLYIGPVPVVLTPVLNVSVGVDGTAHVGFITAVTQQASVAAGVEYLDGRWNAIHTFDNSFTFIPPTLTGDMQLEAYGSVRLGILIYGIGGPYASLNAFFGMDASLNRMPPWRLYGGLRCTVGVRAEILGFSLGNYEETVLDSRTPIAEAKAPTPDTPTPTATATRPPTGTPTPTASPTPSATPTPTPPPPCDLEPKGEFAALWQTYRRELVCPVSELPVPIQDAEQAFDNGRMLWRADTLTIYVLYEKGSLAGTYQAFDDTWKEGDAVYSCAATPPAGRVQPWRGFGKVWCELGAGPSAAIGWALVPEQGFAAGNGDPLVQDYQGGTIFRDSAGTAGRQVYVLISSTNSFVHVAY